MPLISLALEEWETQQGRPRGSTGNRDLVPPEQAAWWREAALYATLTTGTTSVLQVLSNTVPQHACVHLAQNWTWALGNDHLSSTYQEEVTRNGFYEISVLYQAMWQFS